MADKITTAIEPRTKAMNTMHCEYRSTAVRAQVARLLAASSDSSSSKSAADSTGFTR
jgi:hypothetical protein